MCSRMAADTPFGSRYPFWRQIPLLQSRAYRLRYLFAMDNAPCDYSLIRCTMKAGSGFDKTPHVPSIAWLHKTDDLKDDSSNEPTVTSHGHSGGMVKWKVSHSMKEADQYSKKSLYRSLRPIMWSLKLCGLHHVGSFTAENILFKCSTLFLL